jgi:predicted ester cyclase
MSTDENKAVVRRFVHEIFDKGNVSAVDELVDDSFVPHTWPSVTGKEDFKETVVRMAKAVKDPHHTIEDMLAEGDRVSVRLTSHATQTGDVMGVAAAGKEYTIAEQHIFRLEGGKVVEHWHVADMLAMMQQIGAFPALQKPTA